MESDWDVSSEYGVFEERKSGGLLSFPLTKLDWGYIIIFNWDEGAVNPFKIYPCKAFENDIKDKFIDKHLADQFRVRKLKPMKSLPGETVSLFGKMEASEFFLNFISIRFCIFFFIYNYKLQIT